jgi:hypothetical protein
MQRPRLNKLAIVGCAVAVVVVALALAGPSIGSAPQEDGSTGTCADFARDVNPKEVEVESGYDAENEVVYAHTAGRTYRLVPQDPECQTLSGVRAVMDDAIATSRENDDVTCRAVSDAIAQNRTAVRGRGFDRAAAERFVAERCRTNG